MKLKSLLKEAKAPEASKLVQALGRLPEADKDYLEDMTPTQIKELAKIGVEVTSKFPKLSPTEVLEYLYGVFDSSWRGSYTHEYSAKFYDDDMYTSQWKKHANSFSKIQESKKTVREAMDSLTSYYTQAGKIGSGEYNLRNVLEEIDDILMGLDKTTRYELTSAISDAIDMAYDMGMDEGIEQSK